MFKVYTFLKAMMIYLRAIPDQKRKKMVFRTFRGHFDPTPSNREQPSKIEGYLVSMN